MKKGFENLFFALLLVASFTLGLTKVSASESYEIYSYVKVGDVYVYSEKEDTPIGSVEGVSYDAESAVLTLDNADVESIYFNDVKVTILLKGENVVQNGLSIYGSDITVTGSGNLTLDLTSSSIPNVTSFELYSTEISGYSYSSQVKFAMEGVVTSLKGMGGWADKLNEEYPAITFAEGVTITEGGKFNFEQYKFYIGTDDSTFDNRSDVKVVISGKGEEVPPVEDDTQNTVLTNDTTTFESSQELEEGYTLEVEDKKNGLTDEQSKAITDKVKGSTLLLLNDVSVHDGEGTLVEMSGGEYTITFKLTSEQLKKYEKFVAVYVKDGRVEETFDTKVEGEYVSFKTTHLSEYGILGVEEENPNTGSSTILTITMLGLGTIAASTLMVAIKKRIYG